MRDQYEDCFIGIQSIPDSVGQYRLGTIFLRNFVTALDYDSNLIMIGQNAASTSDAYIDGDVTDPNIAPPEMHGLTLIIVMLAIICMLLVLWFVT